MLATPMRPIEKDEYIVLRTPKEVAEYAEVTTRCWITREAFTATKNLNFLPYVLYVYSGWYAAAAEGTSDIPSPYTIEKAIDYVESIGRKPQTKFNIEKFKKL